MKNETKTLGTVKINNRKRNVIVQWPAYGVVEPRADFRGDVNVRHGQTIAVNTGGRLGWTRYTVCTVAGSALERNECPYAAAEQAREHGHDMYSAYANSSSLSDTKSAREWHDGFRFGDVVKLEGKKFTIERAPNQNIKFVEVAE